MYIIYPMYPCSKSHEIPTSAGYTSSKSQGVFIFFLNLRPNPEVLGPVVVLSAVRMSLGLASNKKK